MATSKATSVKVPSLTFPKNFLSRFIGWIYERQNKALFLNMQSAEGKYNLLTSS
jgi:hypothetical protein